MVKKEYRFPIKALAKSRPRFNNVTNTAYMPTVYTAYKNQVKAYAEKIGFIPDPHSLQIEFCFKVPDSLSKKEKAMRLLGGYHYQKPDLDNLVGGVMDALMPDDSGIALIKAWKVWTEDFEGFVIYEGAL